MQDAIRWHNEYSPRLKKANSLNLIELAYIMVFVLTLLTIGAYQDAQHIATNAALNSSQYLNQNPIYRENQKPGTTRWQSIELRRDSDQQLTPQANLMNAISQSGNNVKKTANTTLANDWEDTSISGYAGQTSINRGDSIELYVSTSQRSYNMEVYRMGWYHGTGARLLLTVSNLSGQNQPVPTPQEGTGLIECNWQVSYTLQTLNSWVSGVYLVKLIANNGSVSYIIFVLRDDAAAADILYQVPVATYQAYNNWGGKSLYDYNSTGGRAYKVSFDRPYNNWSGASFFFAGDYNMVRWLESNNYNVTYVTSLDTQTNPLMYTNRKIFLSTWHDEYWSKEMRDNLTSAVAQGKNLAFFGANNMYSQIRFEPSPTGMPNRVEVCYRYAYLDPLSTIFPSQTTVLWRSPPVNNPENALLGVMFDSEINFGASAPWVVINSNNWIYNGTSLKDGDTIPGLVGYEFDKVWDNGLTPKGLIPISRSPVVDFQGVHTVANGAYYRAASSALVFVAGTIYWPWKLDDNSYENHGVSPNVQRMTANVLNRMIIGDTPLNTNANWSFPFFNINTQNIALLVTGSVLTIILLAILVMTIIHRIHLRSNTLASNDLHIPWGRDI